jgi:hypothetical protein
MPSFRQILNNWHNVFLRKRAYCSKDQIKRSPSTPFASPDECSQNRHLTGTLNEFSRRAGKSILQEYRW